MNTHQTPMNPTDPTPLPCPTPRTDYHAFTDEPGNEVVMSYFARQLETELAQAQAELEKLREMKRPWINAYEAIEGMWRAQAEAAAMREASKEAMSDMADFGYITAEAGTKLISALATTAGAEMLERLRNAEALAKRFLPTTTENTKPQ